MTTQNGARIHGCLWHGGPSVDSAGSMPIGNGDLGMNVWVEPGGDLLLLLGKTDAWGDNGRLLKLGRVRISMDPNPFASGQPDNITGYNFLFPEMAGNAALLGRTGNIPGPCRY